MLLALILVAAVANLNLAVANVALPSIGEAFDASQTSLNLIAVGYSLGLAASVLYFGALGDRYGRKLMLLLGTTLAIPFSVLAAWSPNEQVLFVARVGGGLSAGMAFPTTLALITALWSGPGRTRSIALWSGIGAAIASLGPLLAGLLLEHFWWGSVFLLTLPLAVVALLLALEARAGARERGHGAGRQPRRRPVRAVRRRADHRDQLRAVPSSGEIIAIMAGITIVAGAAFVLRQRRAANPLYDLDIAGRRIFWVAACAGIIVFGSLMGSMFIGQQFLQDVLGYDTLDAGAAILPAALLMVLVAPRSAKMVEARRRPPHHPHGLRLRAARLPGHAAALEGGHPVLEGRAGLRPGRHRHRVRRAPRRRTRSRDPSPSSGSGMASGTADLQRDLGGAIMQSIFGALLAAGYAKAANAAIAASPEASQVTSSVQAELTKSFAGAESVAQQYPQYADQIIAAAKTSFLKGDQWAYVAGIVAVLLGAALVAFLFPKREEEEALLAAYHQADVAAASAQGSP